LLRFEKLDNWFRVSAVEAKTSQVINAQRVILERYRPAIHRYLVACLGDTDAADELCQEFALRVVRGAFRTVDPEKGRFRDLLKSSLYHLIIDYHKRRQRGMPQLSPAAPEPAEDSAATLDSDRQFLATWRADLLNKTWEALLAEEQESGQPMHTVLHFRAAHQDLRSDQMAKQLTTVLGKQVSADWVRRLLYRAHERFAELLMAEVTGSLGEHPSDESIVQELIDLELYQYCRFALDRRKE
jgi:RNA polymerase sigma-70 factor (ECF subfamily)